MAEHPKFEAFKRRLLTKPAVRRAYVEAKIRNAAVEPYWMTKASACNTEQATRGPEMGWRCTRPKGHIGKHIAHDLDGSLCASWSPVAPSVGKAGEERGE